MGDEVFQSGLVPSDSDFTIFKEYMPGAYRIIWLNVDYFI